jgi:hypothetical protein
MDPPKKKSEKFVKRTLRYRIRGVIIQKEY